MQHLSLLSAFGSVGYDVMIGSAFLFVYFFLFFFRVLKSLYIEKFVFDGNDATTVTLTVFGVSDTM